MYQPPSPPPADVPAFAPEHPSSLGMPTPEPAPEPAPEPESAPIQEPAPATSWAPAGESAPPAAAASTTNPPPTSDWPEPGKPEAPAAAAAREPGGGGGGASWTPVQTGSWTPGPAHVSSSEWTGEATPVPAPVPEELREAVLSPSYTAPAAYAPPAAAPATAPPIPRAPAPTPARKPAPKRERDDDGGAPSGRPRWVLPAAIVIVLLLVIGGGGAYALSRAGSSTTTGVAGTSPSSKPSSKASPTPTNVLKDVPVYAPAAAAPITSVTIDPANSNCAQIGGSCKVEVDIKFSSVQRGNVSFIIKYFDRCAGTTQDLPGAAFTPPGFNHVILDKTVTLPAGPKAAAVVVVTQSPSTAASAPITLGADSC